MLLLLLIIINFLILFIMVFMSVAFFTLLERKILGYIQLRKGPNKFLLKGIFQPMGDGLKLFFKECNYPNNMNFFFFLFSPMLGMLISVFFWFIYPYIGLNYLMNFGLIFMFCCSSLMVYVFMLISWSSNSNYSVLGMIRFISQMISYEVSMMIIIINLMFLINSFNLNDFFIYQINIKFFFFLFLLFILLFISFLAEMNRSPFDFSEGESELVSGFNIEFSSFSFIFIFMSEYLSIMFMGMLLFEMFFGLMLNKFYLNMFILIFMFLVIWLRGFLPRFRYDKLMYLIWKLILPLSLFMFIFNFSIQLFNLYH
uniref:NADH-ubiquinone oxidoreductase chain 1 n=1 Tax=Mollitrichosiphum tenuicorpus TaxID=1049572 RepID=A0A7T0KBT6_9HEMI|nr:NADH dehydrogenase subunit 1 [Mollitrichosiphum tenuicorpus]QPK76762.1 NADH dehydrogenase subunit 1 [Mollitrichosiphum tenuicorpus]